MTKEERRKWELEKKKKKHRWLLSKYGKLPESQKKPRVTTRVGIAAEAKKQKMLNERLKAAMSSWMSIQKKKGKNPSPSQIKEKRASFRRSMGMLKEGYTRNL